MTEESQTRIHSADWPDTPSATCLTNRRPVFVSRQGSNASVIAVCSILPVWVGTERNHDGLSAIHSAGYELLANRIPS